MSLLNRRVVLGSVTKLKIIDLISEYNANLINDDPRMGSHHFFDGKKSVSAFIINGKPIGLVAIDLRLSRTKGGDGLCALVAIDGVFVLNQYRKCTTGKELGAITAKVIMDCLPRIGGQHTPYAPQSITVEIGAICLTKGGFNYCDAIRAHLEAFSGFRVKSDLDVSFYD